eukprot:CAMPEP_0194536192 /NCGR_PEP_ID=MMETSP0253-20130528/75009_1 /TAXON_ID=2966 /ORGANISM="Noctiluca scintillans" /LENGTH=108 /DNA_ID=CAMNT_0039382079 /DNA_START=243 /DNA_END=569 /DNA_ORIENTATION=+
MSRTLSDDHTYSRTTGETSVLQSGLLIQRDFSDKELAVPVLASEPSVDLSSQGPHGVRRQRVQAKFLVTAGQRNAQVDGSAAIVQPCSSAWTLAADVGGEHRQHNHDS